MQLSQLFMLAAPLLAHVATAAPTKKEDGNNTPPAENKAAAGPAKCTYQTVGDSRFWAFEVPVTKGSAATAIRMKIKENDKCQQKQFGFDPPGQTISIKMKTGSGCKPAALASAVAAADGVNAGGLQCQEGTVPNASRPY